MTRRDSIKNRADAIYHLRVGIRKAFPDSIRMRADIGATFWKYVHILKVRLRLGVSVFLKKEFKDNPCEPVTKDQPLILTKQTKKRKRNANDDDYEDEPETRRGRGRPRAK